MNTIIAVHGRPSCRKTSSIVLATKMLAAEFPNGIVETLDEPPGEIYRVFRINRRKIGIQSDAKSRSPSGERILDLAERECDVIVCATGTHGKTINAVFRLNAAYDILCLHKRHTQAKAQQSSENRATAKQIVTLVRELLET